MLRLLLTIKLAVLATLAAPNGAHAARGDMMIIIANSTSREGIPALPAAEKDGEAMAKAAGDARV